MEKSRQKQLEEFLLRSLDDDRLSRGERQVFRELLEDARPGIHEQEWLLSRAISLAKDRLFDGRDEKIVDWLEDVIKVFRPASGLSVSGSRVAESHFLPGSGAVDALVTRLHRCRRSMDICVFTVTYDKLADEVIEAHRRKVKVRLITDDEKALDLGSDIERMIRAGIKVRMDRSANHMHNKFAILDGSLLVTGSFNWTRSAAQSNQESFIISDDPVLVRAHQKAFESLWDKFGRN